MNQIVDTEKIIRLFGALWNFFLSLLPFCLVNKDKDYWKYRENDQE